jgi:CHAD domain-containing protein
MSVGTGGGGNGRAGLEAAAASAPARIREIFEARGRTVLKARRRVLRGEDGKSVHDLRVATRRLQAALDVFDRYLPATPRKRLDRRARAIRRRLGMQRNARVMLELLRDLRGRLSRREARVAARLEKQMKEAIAGLRRSRRRKGLPGIRKRIRAIVRAVGDHAEAPAANGPTHGQAVLRACREARHGRPEAMHRLRIAIKRYRYALEVLTDAGRPGLERTIGEARALQGALGRLHDLDVLIEIVRRLEPVPGAAILLRRLLRSRSAGAQRVLRLVAGFRPLGAAHPVAARRRALGPEVAA